MPTRGSRICPTVGCSNLTTVTRYCETCRRRRWGLRTDTDLYDDSSWRRTSRAFLRRYPQCAHRECIRAATEVHHIDGLGPRGPRGHDWTNLLPLCKSHHAQITGRTVGFRRQQKDQ